MTNWPETIETLIAAMGASWIETDPALASVTFPYKESRSFLTHPANEGKCMIWATPGAVEPEDSVVAEDPYKNAIVNVYCYSRAASRLQANIKVAEDQSVNMRDQVIKYLRTQADSLTGALKLEHRRNLPPMRDFNVDPVFFIEIPQFVVIYVES